MARVIRWILIGTWVISPWVFRAIWFTIRMIAIAVVSVWSGVGPTSRTIAEDWLERAVANEDFPTEYDRHLYIILRIAAFITLLIGWIALSFLTVGIIHWIL